MCVAIQTSFSLAIMSLKYMPGQKVSCSDMACFSNFPWAVGLIL